MSCTVLLLLKCCEQEENPFMLSYVVIIFTIYDYFIYYIILYITVTHIENPVML